jgi:isoaspartyl peptidase/L-asparaginase-like protein (Ntn-hydrolase superfamily)
MAGIERALEAGMAAMGAEPLEACLAAVRALEDDPLFNAGIGAALNADGVVEHDAAVMEGRALRAGAVAAVSDIRHPVDLARAVMDDGRHVLLVAGGASRFAEAAGVEKADPSIFVVERRRRQLEEWRQGQGGTGGEGSTRSARGGPFPPSVDTVGAVAFVDGQVAAAVSTGGYTGKLPGRVGDSPIPGAGLYADDELGAAVCTGTGEHFMRLLIAKVAVDAMAELDAQGAAERAIEQLGRRLNGHGGLIAVDRRGGAAAAFNTEWMPWGQRTER